MAMPERDYLKFNGLAEMGVVGKPTSEGDSGMRAVPPRMTFI
jgi:hypothetical protein